MPWKHVYGPIRGIRTDIPPTLLLPESSPFIQGCILKDGEIRSDFGYTGFPVAGDTSSNQLNGSVMRSDQFYELSGITYLLALTTTNLYQYNLTTTTWDCITNGVEIDDAEAAWDASADVTSTADATVKMRDDKSAKHVIAAAFTTGIVSSEDDVQNADISASTNTHLSFWARCDTTLAADVFRLRLSEQATGGTGATYADYSLPALTADTWQHVSVAIASPVADDGGTYPDDLNAIASVALVAQSDPGAVTIYLDDIRTTENFTGDEDNRFSVTTMLDSFLITNGVDVPKKVTAAGGVLTLANLSTSLATGAITTSEIVLTFKDHLLLMNNTENAADAPQRCSWTNIGTTEDWINGTAGYQDLVDAEDWIIAAEPMSENEVIIYKERSIVSMVWVGGHTPFRFKTMVSGTGAVAKEGVTTVSGGHAIIGPDVFYEYRGGNTIEILDDNVKRTLYSIMDKSYTTRIFIVYVEEDDELQLWVPTTDTVPNDVWCIGTVRENWYRRTKTMTGFGYYSEQSSLTIGDLVGTIGEQNFRFGDALTKTFTPITLIGDNNGRMYKLNKFTYNNDGAAIANEFQTPDFTLPDTKDYIYRFMRISKFIFEAKGESVTVTYSTDGGSTWAPTQGNSTNVVALDSIYKVYQQDFDTNARKIRFKFYNDTASSSFIIRYYGFPWVPRSERR